jgi:hypothetical protein
MLAILLGFPGMVAASCPATFRQLSGPDHDLRRNLSFEPLSEKPGYSRFSRYAKHHLVILDIKGAEVFKDPKGVDFSSLLTIALCNTRGGFLTPANRTGKESDGRAEWQSFPEPIRGFFALFCDPYRQNIFH